MDCVKDCSEVTAVLDHEVDPEEAQKVVCGKCRNTRISEHISLADAKNLLEEFRTKHFDLDSPATFVPQLIAWCFEAGVRDGRSEENDAAA